MQGSGVIMVRYCVNLTCFAICDIYLKNFKDGEGLNDCVYVSRFIFIKSKPLQESKPILKSNCTLYAL